MRTYEYEILRPCPQCGCPAMEQDTIFSDPFPDDDDYSAGDHYERWHHCPRCGWRELVFASPPVLDRGEMSAGRNKILVE